MTFSVLFFSTLVSSLVLIFCVYKLFRLADDALINPNTQFLLDELHSIEKNIEDDREESFLDELISHLISEGAEAGFKYTNPINKRLYNIKMEYAIEQRIRCNAKKRNLELLIEAKEAKDLYENEGKIKFVSNEKNKRDFEWILYKQMNNLEGF